MARTQLDVRLHAKRIILLPKPDKSVHQNRHAPPRRLRGGARQQSKRNNASVGPDETNCVVICTCVHHSLPTSIEKRSIDSSGIPLMINEPILWKLQAYPSLPPLPFMDANFRAQLYITRESHAIKLDIRHRRQDQLFNKHVDSDEGRPQAPTTMHGVQESSEAVRVIWPCTSLKHSDRRA